jgi:hypothetical protein
MTMKTRIIEEINSNGSSTFYPQRKMLFWWCEVRRPGWDAM